MSRTDVVLAAGGAAWEHAALAHLERSTRLRLVRRCVDVADLLAVIGTESAAVALVSSSLPGLDLDLVDRLTRAGVRPVAVEGDPDLAQRLGLGAPVSIDALDGVADLGPVVPAAEPVDEGRLVAVWGPTGAPGRSTVALSLAAALAESSRVLLVDADVEGGSLGQSFGLLDDVSGLVAACRAANQGQGADPLQHAVEVESGLRLLTGLPRSDMWSQLRPAAYDAVLTAAVRDTDAVVVDCGFALDGDRPGAAGRHQTTVATLERADEIVVVGRAEPLGLTRLVRSLHDLARILPGRSPRLLINQARRTLGWSDREVDAMVARLTGITPHARLPHDPATWDAAAVAGRTARSVAPTAPFVGQVDAFAATLGVRSSAAV